VLVKIGKIAVDGIVIRGCGSKMLIEGELQGDGEKFRKKTTPR
jgi:hypothetical protein